jgi:hypothetical protein
MPDVSSPCKLFENTMGKEEGNDANIIIGI